MGLNLAQDLEEAWGRDGLQAEAQPASQPEKQCKTEMASMGQDFGSGLRPLILNPQDSKPDPQPRPEALGLLSSHRRWACAWWGGRIRIVDRRLDGLHGDEGGHFSRFEVPGGLWAFYPHLDGALVSIDRDQALCRSPGHLFSYS